MMLYEGDYVYLEKWSKWINIFSLLATILIYQIFFMIFKVAMYCFLGCELVGAQDAMMLLDNPTNRHMIMAGCFTEKYEYLNMREHFMNKTGMIRRCRSELVKYFGFHFYRHLKGDEWDSKSKMSFNTVEGIHTEKDMLEWILKE